LVTPVACDHHDQALVLRQAEQEIHAVLLAPDHQRGERTGMHTAVRPMNHERVPALDDDLGDPIVTDSTRRTQVVQQAGVHDCTTHNSHTSRNGPWLYTA
jgi:hypothetical protein